MKAKISFPASVLKPIKQFLHLEAKKLEERKKVLEKEDPFVDTERLTDNAATDSDAREQFGHARVEAMKKEIDRRLIDIRKALTKIKIGKYGICEKCGKMIDTDRLMIKPEATLCIECEKKREK
ncbi:conjugal transfer protein TraR [Candidatus Shapirobacteria bacterium CG10_big_fil_rev_8_21_14_0_10_40_9]|uniref:Conjugal transfer protein TraR n=1 Tax=Candidatus Shapirobacteria bacterium CG10_big_fil_rev_8_21_14_0_10_40_9 TaxID=1974888 RepID=A0A2M8L3J6_9BACT|nr:MAG: conjugal transfer protein TraR [Candidatus Shapirobacteria bacterium CG10_big_fil_rev_8_21_14_0_10_40_9]